MLLIAPAFDIRKDSILFIYLTAFNCLAEVIALYKYRYLFFIGIRGFFQFFREKSRGSVELSISIFKMFSIAPV